MSNQFISIKVEDIIETSLIMKHFNYSLKNDLSEIVSIKPEHSNLHEWRIYLMAVALNCLRFT